MVFPKAECFPQFYSYCTPTTNRVASLIGVSSVACSDVKIYQRVDGVEDPKRPQSVADFVSRWDKAISLVEHAQMINAIFDEKTRLLTIRAKSQVRMPTHRDNGQLLNRVYEARDLGCAVASHLCFSHRRPITTFTTSSGV